jgi:hypothetical protein
MLLTPQQTWIYPTSTSSTIPQSITDDIAIPLSSASTLQLKLPGYFSSGRVYFAAGKLEFFTLLNAQGGVSLVNPDPLNPTDASAGISWSFVEMTYTAQSGLFANLSFVDFLGLPVGMSFAPSGGAEVQTVRGTQPGDMAQVCAALKLKTSEEAGGVAPWEGLCQLDGTGEVLRVNAPGKYIAAVDAAAFRTYYDQYVQQVWAKYAQQTLYVDTQNELGVIGCSTASGKCSASIYLMCLAGVSGQLEEQHTDRVLHAGYLVCDGASRPLAAPLSSTDAKAAQSIFECSGEFSSQQTDNAVDLAVLPRICAALNRSTLLLSGGDRQPSLSAEYYYQQSPTNWYSKAVHDVEGDGRGYAFAYDDVNPSGGVDASGTVSGPGGTWEIFVGGMK